MSGTFLVGKFLLIPALAALGAKFFALLPIFLAKIALLGVMNFIATNINLVISLMPNLKNLFKPKSAFDWPLVQPNDVVLSAATPLNFGSSGLNQNLKFFDFFNRRSNKPEKKKVLRLLDDDFESPSQDKLKFVNPYLHSVGRNAEPVDGNKDQLVYRRINPSASSTGRYRCYWTDSSDTNDSKIRKAFRIFPKNDYRTKDYNTKNSNLNLNYHIDNYNIADFALKQMDTKDGRQSTKSYSVADIDLTDFSVNPTSSSQTPDGNDFYDHVTVEQVTSNLSTDKDFLNDLD